MGLREAFANAATAMFNALGDIPDTATYYAGSTNASYNATTGAVTAGTTGQTVEIIQTYFKRHEIDTLDVLATDIKGLIRQADLTGTPRVDDIIKIGSDNYRVKYYRGDPARAMWMLVLRKG